MLFSTVKEAFAYISSKTKLSFATIKKWHKEDPIPFVKSSNHKQAKGRTTQEIVDGWMIKRFTKS